MGGVNIKFRTIRSLQIAHIPRKFDSCTLQSEAYAKERNLVFPCILYSLNLSFHAAHSKPARHKDTSYPFEACPGSIFFNILRLNPPHLHPGIITYSAMNK